MSHSIFLVEDHTFTRDGLRVALQRDPELQVIGEARSGEEILEKYAAFPAEIVVMDIGLPGIDGIETTKQLKTLYPNVKVVMLTVHQLEQEILAALASGANAYCLKTTDPSSLMVAVRAVALGGAYLDPQISHANSGQTGNLVIQALEVLNVQGTDDIDAVLEKLFDIHVTFGI
jgi:two-component system, NarL family, response regulator LiaR